MKRVLVSVSNDISTDQRLHRTCITLHEEKMDVLVVGRFKRDSKPLKKEYKTIRFRMLFQKGFLFYAFFNIRLFFWLLTQKKDILYANDLDTLLPNYLVSRLQKKQLIFDSHELFSEVPELEKKPFSKKVWRFLEDTIIPRLDSIITVSNGIKTHYQNVYQKEAQVIRNVPFLVTEKPSVIEGISKKKKIILYQGSVNLGRGLELMIDTISLLEDYIFLIAGSGDIIEQLENTVLKLQLEQKVKFLGKLLPNELKKITPNATIGISLEEDLGLNYRYALPNKVFDYVQAKIPVIVSNLQDMSQLVTHYQIGEVLVERTPKALSKLILEMEEKEYSEALDQAKNELIWEKEKKKLLQVFDSFSLS